MKIFLFIVFITLAFCGCQNKQTSNSESVKQQYSETVEQQYSEFSAQSKKQDKPSDFISGGNTYVGTEVKDVECLFDYGGNKKGDIVRYQTHYIIKCYNDGSMTWSKDISKNGGEPSHFNFDGEWKKVTESKHDVVYTWYEFWATTYDMSARSHYSRIGFVDEKGQLYWEGADPVTDIPANNNVLCTVSAQ